MSSTPKISKGLNKFSPSLFDRMGKAIEVAERSEFDDQLKGFKVWPSFWATIIGFNWIEGEGGESDRFRRFLYLWFGGGFSSGLDPLEPEFSPAINLAEHRYTGQPNTYLGINRTRLKESSQYRQMPYITSNSEIVDENGELNKGRGNPDQASSYFKGGVGPTVRMYLLEVKDPDALNPATGEPFDFDDSIGVYAFSATPNFDGPCN